MIGRCLLGLLAALVLATPAAAHTRSQSYSSWTAQGATLTGVFQVGAQRVTQLGEDATFDTLDALLASHLAQTVSVTPGRREVSGRRTETARRCARRRPGRARIRLCAVACRIAGDRGGRSVLRCVAEPCPLCSCGSRGRPGAGDPRDGSIARVRGRRNATRQCPLIFAAFFRLGLEHVLSGIDHLAFIVALALLAGGFGRAVWAATGFTLGHSLTLGLVAAGWLRPDVASVEALIGFTVAFAAGEAFATRDGAGSRVGWATLALVAAIPLVARFAGASALPWTVVIGICRVRALCGRARRNDVKASCAGAGHRIRAGARGRIRRRAA